MFTNNRRVSLFFCLFIFFACYPQDRTIDSLKSVLRNPRLHDTTKLAAVGMVMDSKYTENDPKYYYLNDLIGALARKNLKKRNSRELHKNYTIWLATYYNVLAINYGHKKDAVNGLAAIDKSIALYKSVQAYEDAYYEMIVKGAFYSVVNENGKAISCLFAALKYFEKDKKENSSEIAYAMSVLGNIYAQLGDYKKVITYNKEVVRYNDLNNTHVDYQKDYLKSVAYANITNAYLNLRNFTEAVNYGEKALLLSQKTGDRTNMSLILSKLGTAKMNQLKYGEAESFIRKALSLTTDDRALSQANLTLAQLYFATKKWGMVEPYANKALAAAKNTKDLKLQEAAYTLLYDLQLYLKNYKKAIRLFELHHQVVDSLKSAATKNILAQQQQKYDFEKKEWNYRMDMKNKDAAKNNLLLVFSSVLLFIVLAGYFYYRNNRQRQAISALEKDKIRQQLLITQMNPHFIFNSVQNIRTLINNKQDVAAVDYLEKFAVLTRQILENATENYISLAEELEMIENYLSIQQLLYAHAFTYTISVDQAIDADAFLLPPMLAQPFIENAIKHGMGSNGTGAISIRFYLSGKRLFFEVCDSGKGFGASGKSSGHKSLSMKITRERLAHYTKNQEFKIAASNRTDDAGNVTGAKVHFEIPYLYEN